LPPLPPLRTVQAPFDAYGSSIGNAPAPARGRRMGLAENLYVTAREPTTEPSEAAPARALRSADISALLPQVGLLAVHVRQHQREVCTLSGRVMLPAGSTPIRPITDRPSLAPSSFTRRLISSSCETPSLTGRRRAYHVPSLSLCGLGRASPPVVQRLRRRSSEPPDLTTYLLVQAIQHLALVLVTTVNSASPELTLPHHPGSQLPRCWQSQHAPHGSVAILADEATLFRELRTPRLPMTHVPVGYCGQHRRSCHFSRVFPSKRA